jgi:hypothetical protein
MYFVEDQMIIAFTMVVYVLINNILTLPVHLTVRSPKIKKNLSTLCMLLIYAICGGTQVYHHITLITMAYISIKLFGK